MILWFTPEDTSFIWGTILAILLVVTVVGNFVAMQYRTIITRSLNHKTSKVVEKEGTGTEDTEYFKSDYASHDDLVAYETELSQQIEEEGLIKLVNAQFENVIIMLNTANQMELGWINDYEHIKACVWVGYPGQEGTISIPRIFKGTANPSGRLVDTYAYSIKNSPAYVNFGNGLVENGVNEVGAKNYYKVYGESIYVGYRYYETRYEDSVLGQGNAESAAGAIDEKKWDYTSEVQYPFGRGLSYTEYDYSDFAVTENDDSFTVDVTVTNTGDQAGKDAHNALNNILAAKGYTTKDGMDEDGNSDLGGRNFEYYSEDGYLSGAICAAEVGGAQSKGMYCYLKHLVLNDQEERRYGVSTFTTEQALRELYLTPFEMAVKQSDCHGMMAAFNGIGGIWCAANKGLITNVLTNEWGFHGIVVTDYASANSAYMWIDMGLQAGSDLWLNTDANVYWIDGIEKNLTLVNALRNATHDILYTVVNSSAMNGVSDNVQIVNIMPLWQKWLIAFDIAMAVIILGGIFLIVRRCKKNKAN